MQLESMQQLKDVEGPAMVKAEAEWCGPCKVIGPVVERLCEKYGVPLFTLDVDTHPGLAEMLRVSGLPTIMGFRDGRMVDGGILLPPDCQPGHVEELVRRV